MLQRPAANVLLNIEDLVASQMDPDAQVTIGIIGGDALVTETNDESL